MYYLTNSLLDENALHSAKFGQKDIDEVRRREEMGAAKKKGLPTSHSILVIINC